MLEVAPASNMQVARLPDLSDLGIFQNPYTVENNPVGGLREILPIQRNDDIEDNVPVNIVATNEKNGDWNRMDNNVDYEIDPAAAVANGDYNVYPPPYPPQNYRSEQSFNQIPYQASASTENKVTFLEPPSSPHLRHQKTGKENLGL